MSNKCNKHLFVKSNYPIYLIFILLTIVNFIVNFIYISVEINKPNILKSMGYDIADSSVYEVSLAEVERITAVSNFSLQFERAFIIISLLCMIFLLTKRVQPFFTRLVIMTYCFFSFLFILNLSLAAVFEAPYVNLTQLLILPFLFLILISIYGFVKFRN